MVHKATLIGKTLQVFESELKTRNIVARMALKIASCNMLLATIARDRVALNVFSWNID